MDTRTLGLGLCAILILAAAGCGDREGGSQTGDLLRSDLPRETDPAVDPAELDALVAGHNEFALDLYQRVRTSEGNVVFSPYSISTAYAMAYAGARGATETQMAGALRFALAQDKLHPAFNYLDLDMAGRTGGGEDAPRLNVVNSLWGQRGFPFLSSFLDCLAVNYGAGILVVDFMANPETARLAINRWASNETEGLIQDLVPPEAVSPATVFVLANTAYFKARWTYPFPPEDTTDEPFNVPDGPPVNVPTMFLLELLGTYAEGSGWKAAEIPYVAGNFSMLILLPDQGQLQVFEESLTVVTLDEIVASLASAVMEFTLPRFSCESSLDLKGILPDMGMVDGFSPTSADFSGVNAGGGVWIEASGHKATINVNEYGTEAASGTYVGGWLSLRVPVTVDRPFIFLIRDRVTGTILFLGRVLDPRG